MDFGGLANGFVDIIGRGATVEMNCDRMLSRVNADDGRRNGKQRPVF